MNNLLVEVWPQALWWEPHSGLLMQWAREIETAREREREREREGGRVGGRETGTTQTNLHGLTETVSPAAHTHTHTHTLTPLAVDSPSYSTHLEVSSWYVFDLSLALRVCVNQLLCCWEQGCVALTLVCMLLHTETHQHTVFPLTHVRGFRIKRSGWIIYKCMLAVCLWVNECVCVCVCVCHLGKPDM